MKVKIHNPQAREIEIEGGRQVGKLLGELGLNRAAHLVIRNGEMVTDDEWLDAADVVEIISVISGGK